MILSGKRRQEWFEWGRLSGLIIMIEKRKKNSSFREKEARMVL